MSGIHIHDLPPEILTKALLLVPDSFDLYGNRWIQTLASIGLTCKKWFNIVDEEPGFFSSVFIDHETRPRLLKEWIRKSKACSLSISFRIPRVLHGHHSSLLGLITQVVAILAPVMDRCDTLHLETHDKRSTRILFYAFNILDVSFVRNVTLCLIHPTWAHPPSGTTILPARTLFPRPMPLLRRLCIRAAQGGWNPTASYSALTALHLDHLDNENSVSVDQLLLLLGCTLQLTRLHLYHVEPYDYCAAVSPVPTLPLLTHVHYGGDTRSSSCIFSLLNMPGLHTLKLTLRSPDALTGVVGHFAQVGPQVTSLVLDADVCSVSSVRDLMDVFPNIERLDAVENPPLLTLLLHAIAIHWPRSFATLEVLWLDQFVDQELMHVLLTSLSHRSLVVVSAVELDTQGDATVPSAAYLSDSGTVSYRSSAGYNDFFRV